MSTFRRSTLLALMIVATQLVPPAAAGQEGGVSGFTRKVIGVTRGQTLRFTWANLSGGGRAPVGEPVRVRFTLFAPDGSVVRQTAAPAPPIGESQSFEIARDEIALPGEPGTGRLQLRVEVAIVFSRVSKVDGFAIKQKLAESFPASLEIINGDGATQVYVDGVPTLLNFDFEGELRM